MDTRIVRAGDIYRYDAYADGYTTALWKTVTGTPAIASDLLLFNADAAQSITAVSYGKLEIRALIPTAPTAGDARSWGFASFLQGNESRMEFVITGADFLVVIYDEAGTLIESRECEWNSDWTNAQVRWGIRRSENAIYFTANEEIVHSLTNVARLSRIPMPHKIVNSNADAMTVSVISIYGL